MHVGKRLIGFGSATLGFVGIVICVAGIAGVWIAGSRLQQVNSKVFSRADQLLVQVDRRAAQARDAVGGTRELVDELKQTLQDSAKELLAERVASLPEIDNLEHRLAAAIERADGFVQVSVSTAELVEQLIDAGNIIASDRGVDSRDSAELIAAIRAARESLTQAAQRLADVERRLAEIRQKHEVDVNLSQITNLSLGVAVKLGVVQEQIAVFRTRLDETKIRLGQLQRRIRAGVVAGQCLILLLIAWGGAGQYCLLLHGWRILRTPSSPAG